MIPTPNTGTLPPSAATLGHPATPASSRGWRRLGRVLGGAALLGLALFTTPAQAAPKVAPGKTQQLTSADQVPEGLAKSDWSSIRAAYEAGRHAFQPVAGQDGVWQARSPGQQWTTKFDGRGFLAQPSSGGWAWGLELQSYGFGETQTAIGGTPAVQADGTRLSYQWNAAVQEWFVNDPRGLEHGFTVQERPAQRSNPAVPSSPSLSFLLATRGSLRPSISSDALAVAFQDESGATVLNYAGLKVWDADGKVLASRFEAAGDKNIRLVVDERGARYPLTVDPTATIAQQAYLKASNTGAGDSFGYSVAVSGDTVIVGANGESSNATGVNGNPADNSATQSGAAYVFTRSGTTWSQQAYLKASNTGATDQFGRSVAISGDTVVVGAPNEDSNATGVNGNQADNSATQSGAAYVFIRSGTTWSQQAYLKASNTGANDQFGASVAVSGDTVVVGAYGESSNATGVNGNPTDNSTPESGAAYVFTRSGTTWSQQAYLKASNTGSGDLFGYSVAISGDTVVVGAYRESSNATGVNAALTGGSGTQADNSLSYAGAAYVFTRSGTTWSQQAYLKASNPGGQDLTFGIIILGDNFGASVAVSGDTVVVGAPNEASNATGVNGDQTDNSTPESGAAYVFTRSGTTWSQQAYLKASNPGFSDGFGGPVAVSGDTVVVGAYGESSNATGVNGNPADNSATQSGAAYVFTRSGTTWSQQAYLKASNTEVFDYFGGGGGYAVAVAGDTVVVGALGEGSNATGVNGNQADNSAAYAGAAYVFTVATVATGPTVVSVVRLNPSAQALASGTAAVIFRVTYSEPVTNVEAAGFAVVGVNGGTVTGTIGIITGGPTVYDVAVVITGGSGEFRLNVVN